MILQATEALREADRFSDKYGLTTVLLVCFCLLLLLAVWKVILPMFREAQAKYDAAMKAQNEQQKEQTRDFLAALRDVTTGHKVEVTEILNSLRDEHSRKGKK